MKLTTILLTLGLGLTTAPSTVVLAAPAPESNYYQQANTPDIVDMFVNANYYGDKYTGSAYEGQCVNLPPNFNDNLSSGRARPGYHCTVWPDANCRTNKWNFTFDDRGSGARFPDWINDRASSWRCVRY
ncbi:hypothetical protein NEUTE2DRAFT_141408 [Neurospora tetrasperma FGSC 2509]|nr:hypothetical protein NEUTE2DRAFT_141408 [Neurospora tetrasperma FGSC 2509]